MQNSKGVKSDLVKGASARSPPKKAPGYCHLTGDLERTRRQLENQLKFRPLHVVQEERRHLIKSYAHGSPVPFDAVKAKLEAELRFKSPVEVEAQRRQISSNSPRRNQTMTIREAKHLLENQLHFKSRYEVDEQRRLLAKSTISPEVYSAIAQEEKMNSIKNQLEHNLHFKSHAEVEAQQKSLVISHSHEDIKRKLESQLHFKPKPQVDEERRLLAKSTISDPVYNQLSHHKLQNVHFHNPQAKHIHTSIDWIAEGHNARQRLARDLRYKTQTDAMRLRQQVVKPDCFNSHHQAGMPANRPAPSAAHVGTNQEHGSPDLARAGRRLSERFGAMQQQLERNLHFKSPDQLANEQRLLVAAPAASSVEQTRSILEQKLHFKPRAVVENEREKLTKTEFDAPPFVHAQTAKFNVDQLLSGSHDEHERIKHKLEQDLHFRRAPEVDQMRRIMTQEVEMHPHYDQNGVRHILEKTLSFKQRQIDQRGGLAYSRLYASSLSPQKERYILAPPAQIYHYKPLHCHCEHSKNPVPSRSIERHLDMRNSPRYPIYSDYPLTRSLFQEREQPIIPYKPTKLTRDAISKDEEERPKRFEEIRRTIALNHAQARQNAHKAH